MSTKMQSQPNIDPHFENLFPPHELTGEELNAYLARLKTEGIVFHVWQGKLLNNFFEFELVKQHNFPHRFINVECGSVAEATRFCIDLELQRRHLSAYQRSVLVINYWEPFFKALADKNKKLSQGRGKKGRKKNTSLFEHINVNERLARKAHVSSDTINKVKRILTEGTQEEKAKAEAETKSINSICEDIKHRRRHSPPQERPFRTDLKAGVVDNVICKKAVDGIRLIPDGLITLCCTSPNFNTGKNYPDGVNDDIPHDTHLNNLRETFTALRPKFRKGGKCVIEYQETRARGADEKKKYYYRPAHHQIVNMMEEAGYRYFRTLIWNKQSLGRELAAHGSFSSPHKPLISNTHSYILVFYVDDETLECQTGHPSELNEEDFERLTKTVWNIAPEYKGYGSNPCPMPVQLAEDIIKVFSYREDTVLDCYGGSGSTAIACLRQGRHYIHIDCSQTCCADAKERIEKEVKKLNQNNDSKKAA